MAKRKNGKITETVSVGTKESVGEGSQSNPNLKKEMLPPKDVEDRYSKVILSYGMTKSIGDFEFIRIDVGAEEFCDRDKKQETWDALHKEVSSRIEKILNETEKFRNQANISKPTQPQSNLQLEEVNIDLLEKKKTLNRLILNASKFGKIRYQHAIDKLKGVNINEELCDKLINDLNNKNYDYFNDEGESDGGSGANEEAGEVSFEPYL